MSRVDELVHNLCPEGVRYRSLAELTMQNLGGGTPSRTRSDFWNGDIPWASVGDITATDLSLNSTRQSITQRGLANSSSNIIPPGWVIVATKITPGTMRVVHRAVAINQDLRGLKIVPDVDVRFLAYVFQTIKVVGNGTIVKGVSNAALGRIRVPVPPLEIQHEVVRMLDRLTALEMKLDTELKAEIGARRRQNERCRNTLMADARKSGIPTELGKLGRIVTGRTPKSSDSAAWGDELDFVTPSDIKNGMKTVTTPRRRLSAAGAYALATLRIPAGSLLVTCIGADMGKTVVNANECVTNQQVNSIVLEPGIERDYIFHVLTSMRKNIRAQGERGGGTMPILKKSDFSRIQIPIPSLPTQRRIARSLNELTSLMNELNFNLSLERDARRKQYEHYRRTLLRFKEAQ